MCEFHTHFGRSNRHVFLSEIPFAYISDFQWCRINICKEPESCMVLPSKSPGFAVEYPNQSISKNMFGGEFIMGNPDIFHGKSRGNPVEILWKSHGKSRGKSHGKSPGNPMENPLEIPWKIPWKSHGKSHGTPMEISMDFPWISSRQCREHPLAAALPGGGGGLAGRPIQCGLAAWCVWMTTWDVPGMEWVCIYVYKYV